MATKNKIELILSINPRKYGTILCCNQNNDEVFPTNSLIALLTGANKVKLADISAKEFELNGML